MFAVGFTIFALALCHSFTRKGPAPVIECIAGLSGLALMFISVVTLLWKALP